jgi:hypothetical protein
MIGEPEIIEQIRHLELSAEGFGVDPIAPRSEFVAALSDVVPDQNVAVETVRVAQGLLAGIGDQSS